MLSWLPPRTSRPSAGRSTASSTLIYYLTTAVTFFAVQITLLVFLFMYRDRPGRRATYTHGNTTLEIIWTVVPAVILVVLALRQPLDVGRDQGDASRRATSTIRVDGQAVQLGDRLPGARREARHRRRRAPWTTTSTCR